MCETIAYLFASIALKMPPTSKTRENVSSPFKYASFVVVGTARRQVKAIHWWEYDLAMWSSLESRRTIVSIKYWFKNKWHPHFFCLSRTDTCICARYRPNSQAHAHTHTHTASHDVEIKQIDLLANEERPVRTPPGHRKIFSKVLFFFIFRRLIFLSAFVRCWRNRVWVCASTRLYATVVALPLRLEPSHEYHYCSSVSCFRKNKIDKP